MVNAITFGYLTAGPVKDGQDAGEIERSTPVPYRDTPSGYVSVPVGKGCVLILTKAEYVEGLKRGKVWRRRLAGARRPKASP